MTPGVPAKESGVGKHTDGPWLATTYLTMREMLNSNYQIRRENGQVIAVTHRDSWATKEEEKANARLLAAAPELLSSLQAILVFARFGAHEMGTDTTEHQDFVAARAAIARATGEK